MQIGVKLFVLNENAAKHLHYIWIPAITQPSHGLYDTYDYSEKICDPNKRDAKGKTDDLNDI